MKSRRTPGFLRVWPRRLLLLFLIVTSPTLAFAGAQAVTGTILGRVTDGSGAIVPGVTVTLTNTGTRLTRVVTTDTDGEYAAPSLPTGEYSVAAEISGFKSVTMSNVDLGVDQHVRIDIKLEVGALSETVTIEATSPLVQTSSSELGTTVTNEQIEAGARRHPSRQTGNAAATTISCSTGSTTTRHGCRRS